MVQLNPFRSLHVFVECNQLDLIKGDKFINNTHPGMTEAYLNVKPKKNKSNTHTWNQDEPDKSNRSFAPEDIRISSISLITPPGARPK